MPGSDETVVRAFLFTDIEGSTRLWEHTPGVMPAVLELHDSLIEKATRAAGGRVFKSIGDAICATFPDALSATAAAIASQRALTRLPWHDLGLEAPLRVRMAIQSGPAEVTGSDFAGPVLNRLSRLLRAGHGGQILLTGEDADEIAADLPSGITFRDLGERRLRDLPGRVRIVQVIADDLPSTFPPLQALDEIAHNLPSATDAFFGRESEQQRLRSILSSSSGRLATLLGPGGIGKTRLATESARQLLDEFADGVWIVDLSPLRAGGQLHSSLMRVLGLRESAGANDEDTLLSWLRGRELLLLLDNCEQIIDEVAQFAADALRSAPKLKILATSRVPFEIRGEQRVPLDPLALPESRNAFELAAIQDLPAIQLFASRAQSVLQTFNLDSTNIANVAGICRQVDGIPLAIEIAAVRIATMSPGELREHLEQRLPALTGGQRDMPARHRTLRDAIAWSFELLSDAEQHVFAQLAIFTGGWSQEAAEQIVLSDANPGTSAVLQSLMEKSLVRTAPGIDDEHRFMMLETIREFALETLHSSNEQNSLAIRHAKYFATVAIDNERASYEAQQDAWFERIALDNANYLTSIDTLVSADQTRAQQLAVALFRYWFVRGGLSEGLQVYERVLHNGSNTDPLAFARALHAQAGLLIHVSKYSEARASLERAKALREQIGDIRGVAAAEINLGYVARELGDFETARKHQEIALKLLGPSAAPEDLGTIHMNISMMALEVGQTETAKRNLEKCRSLFTEAGDRYGVANSLARLATVARIEGHLSGSRAMLDEACADSQLLKDEAGMAYCDEARAMLALAESNVPVAAREIDSAIQRLSAIGDQKLLVDALLSACKVLSAAGMARDALMVLGQVKTGIVKQSGNRMATSLKNAESIEAHIRTAIADADRGLEFDLSLDVSNPDVVQAARSMLALAQQARSP